MTPIEIDIDAVDSAFVEGMVKEYASYRTMAEARRPKAEELAAKLAKAEQELEVLRGEAASAEADFTWAANRTRFIGSMIGGICKAKNWGMPEIPAEAKPNRTSEWPQVPTQPGPQPPQPPANGSSGPYAPITPEELERAAQDGVKHRVPAEVELDEYDEADDGDDNDPPAATGDGDKPRTAQQMRDRIRGALASFSWPVGRGRHVAAVRAT